MGRIALYRHRRSAISSMRPMVLPKRTEVARAIASPGYILRNDRTNQ